MIFLKFVSHKLHQMNSLLSIKFISINQSILVILITQLQFQSFHSYYYKILFFLLQPIPNSTDLIFSYLQSSSQHSTSSSSMSNISMTKPSPQQSQITNSHHSQQLISAYIRLNNKKAYLVQIYPKITLSQLYKLVAYHLKLQPHQILIITKGKILKEAHLPVYGTNSFITKENTNTESYNQVLNIKMNSKQGNSRAGVQFSKVQLLLENKQIFHVVLYQNVYRAKSLRLLIKQLIKVEDIENQFQQGQNKDKIENQKKQLGLNVPSQTDLPGSIQNKSGIKREGKSGGNESSRLSHVYEVEGISRDIEIKVLLDEILCEMQVPLINNKTISSRLMKCQQGDSVELPPYIEFGLLRSLIRDEAVLVYTGRILASRATLEEQFVEDNAELVVTFRKPLIVKSLIRYYRLVQQKGLQSSTHCWAAENEQTKLQTSKEYIFPNQNKQQRQQNDQFNQQAIFEKQAQKKEEDINFTFSPHKALTTEQTERTNINLQTENHQSNRQIQYKPIDQLQSTKVLNQYDESKGVTQVIQLESANKLQLNEQQLNSPYFMEQRSDSIPPTQNNRQTIQITGEQVQNTPSNEVLFSVQSPYNIRKLTQHIKTQTDINFQPNTSVCQPIDTTPIQKLLDKTPNNNANDTTPIDRLEDTPIDKQEVNLNYQDVLIGKDTLIDRLDESNSDNLNILNISPQNTLNQETILQTNNETNHMLSYSVRLQGKQEVSINYMSPQALQALQRNQISSSLQLLVDNNCLDLQPINEDPQDTQLLHLQQNNTQVSVINDQLDLGKDLKMDHFSQELVQQQQKLSLQNARNYHQIYHSNTQNLLQDITQLQTQQHHQIQSQHQAPYLYSQHQATPQQQLICHHQHRILIQLHSPNPNQGNLQQDHTSNHYQTIQTLFTQKLRQHEELEKSYQEKSYQMLTSYTRLIDGLTGNLLPKSLIQNQKYLALRKQVDSMLPPTEAQMMKQYSMQSQVGSNAEQNGSSELRQQIQEFSAQTNQKLNSSKPQSLPVAPKIQLQIPKSGSQQAISFAQESLVVSSIEMNGEIEHKKQIQGRKIYEYVESYNGNLLDINPIQQNSVLNNTQINKLRSQNLKIDPEKSKQLNFDLLQPVVLQAIPRSLHPNKKNLLVQHQQPYSQDIRQVNSRDIVQLNQDKIVQLESNDIGQLNSHDIVDMPKNKSLNDFDSQCSDRSNPWTENQGPDSQGDSQNQAKVKFTEGDLLYTIELDLNPKPKLIDAIAYEYHDLLCKNLQEFVQNFGNIIPQDDPQLYYEPFSSDDKKLKSMMGV